MENFTLMLACILGIGVIVMIIKKVFSSQPKWQRVYFFLVGEWHRKDQRSWSAIQIDLMERYGLNKVEAALCIEHWGESSDWFEAQSWLNEGETKIEQDYESVS